MAEEEEGGQSGPNPFGLALLGVVFLPAGVVGLAFYLLLRRGRFPLSTLFQIFVLFEIFVLALWVSMDAWGSFTSFFSDLGGASSNLGSLALPLTLFYSGIGGILGIFIAWWEIRQMKINPHRLELKGNWQFNFKFRRTIAETLSRKKKIQKLKQGILIDEDRAPMGINERDDRIAYRYYSEAATHTMISGASGSGKTLSQQSLIRADLANHCPTVIVDFKRSPEFASKISAWADEFGCEFYHFVNGDSSTYDIKFSKGQATYDPLAAGTPTSKADMILGMREYDTASAVYKANMQQLLQVLFSMLHYADRSKTEKIKWNEGGLYLLASVLSGDNITELAIACAGTPIGKEAEEVTAQVKSRGSGLKHAFEELQGQLRTIVASEYGQWMRTNSHSPQIDLFKLTQKKGTVILFSLNSDSEPEFARYVGSMILADLTNTSARRRNEQLKNNVQIYVDEFQAVTPSAVTSLLEKSRESKMAVTLAQQSFEQIIKAAPASGEAYLLSILDTCSNFLVHNGMTEDSAERLSKILGKHKVTKYRSTNKNESSFLSMNWSNRRNSVVSTEEEEEWIFSPREFMSLMSPLEANGFKSTAVLINKSCSDPAYAGRAGALARTLWMVPALEVLETYYDPTYRLNRHGDSSIDVVMSDGASASLLPGDELLATEPKRVMKTVSMEDLSADSVLESDREIAAALASRRSGKDANPVQSVERESAFAGDERDDIEEMKSYGESLSSRLPKKEDVGDLWSEQAPPPRRTEKTTESSVKTGLPIPPVRSSGLPVPGRPTGGLPIPKREEALPLPQDDDPEEESLPMP